MASEVHDLLVKVRPEGVSETSDQMDELGQSFGNTTDQVEESAGLLSDFSEQFKGASGVIIAGLGTLAAGLLTQVPVIGEAVSGINAIIESLVLRIDQQLRPALGRLTPALFGFADAILTATGPLGTAVDFLSIFIASALTLSTLVGVLAAGIAGASAAAGVLGVSVAAILAPIALASAAFATMAIIWKENIFGIRDILTKFIDQVIEGDWLGAMGTLLTGAVSVTTQLVALFDKFGATVATAFETMGALVVSALKRLGNMAISILEDTVNAAIEAIPSQVRSQLGISTVSLGQPFDPRSVGEIGAAAGRNLNRRFGAIDRQQQRRAGGVNQQIERVIAALQNTDQQTLLQLDSRTVAEAVEPLIGEGATNSGATTRTR